MFVALKRFFLVHCIFLGKVLKRIRDKALKIYQSCNIEGNCPYFQTCRVMIISNGTEPLISEQIIDSSKYSNKFTLKQ